MPSARSASVRSPKHAPCPTRSSARSGRAAASATSIAIATRIDVFTKAIAEHPTDARLYRHRGHRYITIRKLPEAIADLARARELIEGTTDAIEPDGMPNAANTPTSTLHGNIYYHLALAHHLQGDDDAARGFFQRAFDVATTDDSRVAAAYWLAILGQPPELPDAPTLLENHAYWDLIRLFRKQATIDEVRKHDAGTVGYGIARFHLANGDRRAAVAELREVVAGEAWPSFGFIAAEALLLRTRQE